MRRVPFVVGAAFLLATLLLWRGTMIFVLVALAAAFLVFWNYRLRLPFDFSPILALSFAFTDRFGLLACGIFVVACGFAPSLIAGGSIDHTSVFYFFIIIAANALYPVIGISDVVVRMIVLVIGHNLVAFAGASYLGGNPAKELGGLVFKSVVDVFYVVRFVPLLLMV